MDPAPVVADAQPAGSSPATDPSPLAPSDSLENLSESQLHDWRMDGKLPSDRPAHDPTPPADSSPVEPAAQVASTDASPKPTASEPVAKSKGAEARIPELLADRARANERAERAERHIRELEARQTPPPPDARPAASSAAPAGLTKPNPAGYEYGVADPEYLEALTDYKVAATLATERAAVAEGQQRQQAAAEQRRILEGFAANIEAAKAQYPDFEEKALQADSVIPPGSLSDALVWETKAGPHLLYHLQTHPAEARRISALSTVDQMFELVRLADRLTATAVPGSSTQAPPPPPILSTRAAPGDPVERAIAADDFAAYRDAMNKRELARLTE